MKRSSTAALPVPKVRKQAPVDDYKQSKSRTKQASTARQSEPKSILKKPLRPESSVKNTTSPSGASKPKGSISGASIVKANTLANRSSRLGSKARSESESGSGSGSGKGAQTSNGKAKVIAVRASRGDVTGGMGRQKRRVPVEKGADSSESDNDGEDERESDDEDEQDDEDDDDIDMESKPLGGEKRSSKKHSEESMAEAMSKILGSTLRKADADMPILARSRGAERKIEEEKMEAKARRAITTEKKRLASKDHVKPEYTGMDYEKKLRKVATRGVVQLFNAIKAQQKTTDDLTEQARPITTNEKEKVANLSKASFLDLLKSGTKVSTV